MDLLKSLKSLVTEEVEVPDEPIKIPKATSVTPPVTTTSNYSVPNYSSVSSVDTAEIDASIKAKFEEALASNTPPLYTELNDTVAMLSEDIPNVASRYKAAIKLLTKRGATSAAIISAFDSCLQVIEKRRIEFKASAEKKIQEKVGSRKTEIDNCDRIINQSNNQIVSLNKQIEEFEKQIQDLSSKKTNLENEIIKEQASIKLKQERVEIVYNQLFSDFSTQKQNLLDYSK